ncbi:hypothetical protein HPC49_02950 [Pyxidicoccus fallax]|uniref:Lipoprotein n=1 Tax=Pyxidicoccus fallax TaxID=394095 RepID=A0A848LAI6_9BACT|nr:hypothetical protein [Pyxidicoccus fallax]NMO15617.1 hypothetical protein [Pyxidicoccus fallax]NPC77214.1 hypothetical protein [Pyxidicoccus fallax]
MKRVVVLGLVGLMLAGCGEDAGKAAAQKRLEAAQAELRAEETKAQALTAEVERLKGRLSEAETARATERRALERVQTWLTASWRGEAGTLKSRMQEAEVPAALRASLEEAQKARGGEALEQRFRQAVERKDLPVLSSVVSEWASMDGVTPMPPVEEEAEEAAEEEAQACERVQGDFRCTPLPLGGAQDTVTQLCRLSGTGKSWVVRSDHGRLAYAELVPGDRHRYVPVRTVGSDVWLLKDEPGAGKPGVLEVFQVSGTQAVRRLSLDLMRKGKPTTMVEADLDDDGLKETLVVGADTVEAVHVERSAGALSQWREAYLCPIVEQRSEKELEPAKAACSAWMKTATSSEATAAGTKP